MLQACQRDPNARFQDAREMAAALEADPGTTTRAVRRRIVAIAAAALLLMGLLAAGGVFHFWPSSPPPIEVNFITEPFEATICVDGCPLLGPDGRPYATPCTVTGLSARPHSVVLKHEGLPDRDVGRIDFSSVREVTVRWPAVAGG